jgi:tetratricopeptide (TPR) repeat protein
LEKTHEALEDFDLAIRIAPKDREALFCKGVCLQAMENHMEAISIFQSILSVDSCNTKYLYHQGLSLHAVGKLEAAIDTFDKIADCVTSSSPLDAAVLNSRALALMGLSLYEEACEDLNSAINNQRVNSKVQEAYFYRAECLVQLCKYKDALNDYDEALKRGFTDSLLFYSRSKALRHQGLLSEALDDAHTAIKMNEVALVDVALLIAKHHGQPIDKSKLQLTCLSWESIEKEEAEEEKPLKGKEKEEEKKEEPALSYASTKILEAKRGRLMAKLLVRAVDYLRHRSDCYVDMNHDQLAEDDLNKALMMREEDLPPLLYRRVS